MFQWVFLDLSRLTMTEIKTVKVFDCEHFWLVAFSPVRRGSWISRQSSVWKGPFYVRPCLFHVSIWLVGLCSAAPGYCWGKSYAFTIRQNFFCLCWTCWFWKQFSYLNKTRWSLTRRNNNLFVQIVSLDITWYISRLLIVSIHINFANSTWRVLLIYRH